MREIIYASEYTPCAPAQWDLIDREGTHYYLRYRHARIELRVSDSRGRTVVLTQFDKDIDLSLVDMLNCVDAILGPNAIVKELDYA